MPDIESAISPPPPPPISQAGAYRQCHCIYEPGYDKTGLWGENMNIVFSLQTVFRYLNFNRTKFHGNLSFLSGENTRPTSVLFALCALHFLSFPQNGCLSPERKLLYLHMIGYALCLESRQLSMSVHVSICSNPIP